MRGYEPNGNENDAYQINNKFDLFPNQKAKKAFLQKVAPA